MTKPDLPGVGVFGTGTATKKIVPLLRKEGFQVEALWGRMREEAELLSGELRIPYATNLVDEVLLRKDVDLVVILCPPTHHSQIAVKALGIGKHVVVQCPGGLNQDEALRMVQAAQYYPRLSAALCCGLRFLPAFEKMRRAVAGGVVGTDVKLCDVRVSLRGLVGKRYSWRCDEGMGGGALNLVGSHVVDLLHFLTGGRRATRAHGSLRTTVEETETIRGIRRIGADDFAAFQLELEGGAFAAVTLRTQTSGFQQEVMVSGSEGYLVAKNGNLYHCRRGGSEEPLYLDEEEEEEEAPDIIKRPEVGPNAGDETEGDEALVSGIYLRGLGLLFRHLAGKFQSNEEAAEGGDNNNKKSPPGDAWSPLATFEHAQYVQSVLEAVRRSSRQRCWTQVTQKKTEEEEQEETALGGEGRGRRQQMLQMLPPLSPRANLLQKQQLLHQQMQLLS